MQTDDEEMLPEYDLAAMGKPERGKHLAKYQRYVRTVCLPDDLVDRFPDEKSILDALRRDTYGHAIVKEG
jgi:hypothetical protein